MILSEKFIGTKVVVDPKMSNRYLAGRTGTIVATTTALSLNSACVEFSTGRQEFMHGSVLKPAP